ncbi:MAG: tRNA threonylcarbamoyladenosine dehydratase [Sandaracinaceae bacterium]|nr:tRNA threonylcarbamoyladenosine dehydratase [Sandaracinaceae bacterium]
MIDVTPAPALEDEPALRTHRRFDRAARLVSEPGLHALMRSRVLVIGMGGVGSFAAESLARSAVGELVLIDFDDVCVTNANRQLHALRGNIGKAKVDVMADRLRLVNPASTVTPVARFYEAETSEELLAGRVDYVVDAIDNLTAKAHLVATCVARSIPIVSSMGAAARLDPTQIRVADLADTRRDPFARALRKILRKEHGVSAQPGAPIGVRAVYSEEIPREPAPISYDAGTGFVCVCPGKDNGKHTCEHRARIDGSMSFVTGAFGLAAASVVVRSITGA